MAVVLGGCLKYERIIVAVRYCRILVLVQCFRCWETSQPPSNVGGVSIDYEMTHFI